MGHRKARNFTSNENQSSNNCNQLLIVCIGVSHPPLKNISPLINKRPLNLQTVQAPFLGNPAPIYWFLVSPSY